MRFLPSVIVVSGCCSALSLGAQGGTPPRDSVVQSKANARADSAGARRHSLEAVVVRAVRASAATPASQHVVTRASLAATYAGQDAPLALAQTPSITAYSDAGGYSGYSYLRLRGIDQTRVNITFDGVPLNDPEDQVLYFSNVPDLLSSAQSVQIQRGVGASSFGTASYAGSMNIESVSLTALRRGGTVALTGGSFNTARASVQAATGMRDGGWAAYARVTKQHTDGYRYHSGNDAHSAFASAGWFGDRAALKLSGFAGVSATREAYLATSESDLAADRRTNPLSAAEGDRFHQELLQMQYTVALAPWATLSATAYRNSAAGAFDVNVGAAPSGSALIDNFSLAHVWFGGISALSLRRGALSADLGLHVSDYHREHALAERPLLSVREYTNIGFKREQSGFAKVAYDLQNVRLSADLQLRRAAFRYEPSRAAGIDAATTSWTFVNPRLGVQWQLRGGAPLAVSVSYGRSSREPSRGDMFAGADDLNASNAGSILPLTRVRPETVHDLEAGATWHSTRLNASVNLFALSFRDEIAPIGALSLTGSPLRRNVPKSSRRGAEADVTWRVLRRLSVGANLTAMDARIDEYADESAGTTLRNVAPLLTPEWTSNQTVEWTLTPAFLLTVQGRYVGRSFLANDADLRFTLPPAWLAAAAVTWSPRRHDAEGPVTFRAQLDNLFNANAFAGGYHDGRSRYFYPVATRSVLLTSTFTF